jgi:hypothetical protein
MKIGRNDPCPCGSGKKFKNCCLSKTAPPSQELYYRRLSEAHDRLVKNLLPLATRTFGGESVHIAMHEFLLWPEDEEEITETILDRTGPLFWPWYLFNWEYDPEDAAVELPGPKNRTVAEVYAEERADKLDPLERRLIESINRKPYSFLEVLSVEKGKGMTLQDILKGTRIGVQERAGSQFVQPADVLFGRAVSVDGVGMLMGLGTTVIPPRHKPKIIELRKRLHGPQDPITDETLHDWDVEIRELYFAIDHALHTRPQMCNTDGDPLEFHRLIYDVSSAEEAFQKLSDLCVTMTSEELLDDAKRDGAGRIIRAEIPWDRLGHKKVSGLPNTTLGRIMIDGRRLTAEVNSAKRAAKLRRELDVRLGGCGRFRVDEIQDLDSVLNSPEPRTSRRKTSKEHEDLMQRPEVQEQMAQIIGKHWESWVDQKIPALGGKTPRQAIRTSDGREAVEALLMDAERDQRQDPFTAAINRKGAQRARELLGLN